MGGRRGALGGLLVAWLMSSGLLAATAPAVAAEIRIGEISSYSALPGLTEPYRKGWQMAVDEINLAGGIDGRLLTVVSLDDAGKPARAAAAADLLVSRDHVALLAGGTLSEVGLALGGVAKRRKVLYLAGQPSSDDLVWSAGNRYTFRLRASAAMQAAMLAEAAAKLPARRWATVAPDDEDGRSTVATFRKLLSERRPEVTWVAEQWPAPGRIDVGAVARSLAGAKPEAILEAETGADLVKLVREGTALGLFADRAVVSLHGGEPEDLDAFKDEAPEGWIVAGYPSAGLRTRENDAFVRAYQARYNEMPKMGSVVGYTLIRTAAAILRRAGATGADRLIAAAEGLAFDSPFGPAQLRAIDHQSTLGTFVGRTALRNNRGIMTEFAYRDGARYLPADDAVRSMRPRQ